MYLWVSFNVMWIMLFADLVMAMCSAVYRGRDDFDKLLLCLSSDNIQIRIWLLASTGNHTLENIFVDRSHRRQGVRSSFKSPSTTYLTLKCRRDDTLEHRLIVRSSEGRTNQRHELLIAKHYLGKKIVGGLLSLNVWRSLMSTHDKSYIRDTLYCWKLCPLNV